MGFVKAAQEWPLKCRDRFLQNLLNVLDTRGQFLIQFLFFVSTSIGLCLSCWVTQESFGKSFDGLSIHKRSLQSELENLQLDIENLEAERKYWSQTLESVMHKNESRYSWMAIMLETQKWLLAALILLSILLIAKRIKQWDKPVLILDYKPQFCLDQKNCRNTICNRSSHHIIIRKNSLFTLKGFDKDFKFSLDTLLIAGASFDLAKKASSSINAKEPASEPLTLQFHDLREHQQ